MNSSFGLKVVTMVVLARTLADLTFLMLWTFCGHLCHQVLQLLHGIQIHRVTPQLDQNFFVQNFSWNDGYSFFDAFLVHCILQSNRNYCENTLLSNHRLNWQLWGPFLVVGFWHWFYIGDRTFALLPTTQYRHSRRCV